MDMRPDIDKWVAKHHVVMTDGDAMVCRVPHTALDWMMLGEIIEHPAQTVASAREPQAEWSARQSFTLPHLEPIHRRFEICAQINPGARAVKFGEDELTYGELDSQADSLAAILQDQGLLPREVCAVLMPESLARVRAILAVLKAGGACLMLDPSCVGARLAAVLRACGARTVLTQREESGCFSGMDANVVCGDGNTDTCSACWPSDCPTGGVAPACAVCRCPEVDAPTVVFQQHIDVLDRVERMQAIAPIGHGDSVLQGAGHAPGEAVWQSLWPLTHGARLVILPHRERLDLERVRRLTEREHITVMHLNFR